MCNNFEKSRCCKSDKSVVTLRKDLQMLLMVLIKPILSKREVVVSSCLIPYRRCIHNRNFIRRCIESGSALRQLQIPSRSLYLKVKINYPSSHDKQMVEINKRRQELSRSLSLDHGFAVSTDIPTFMPNLVITSIHKLNLNFAVKYYLKQGQLTFSIGIY